jgi:hypothetical protein
VALFTSQTNKRLDIPDEPGQWVEIKTAMTVGMRNRALSAAMTLRMSDAGDAQFDAFAYKQAQLKEIVVAWSDSRPVTPAAVEDLDPEMADWILAQFDALSAPRTEEETAFLGGSSTDGSPQEPPSTAPAPGQTSSPTPAKSSGSEAITGSPT